MIIMKRLNKNLPYQLGGNFRRDLIENFDSLDKGYIEIIELMKKHQYEDKAAHTTCLLYTSPSPRDKRQSRMPSSA